MDVNQRICHHCGNSVGDSKYYCRSCGVNLLENPTHVNTVSFISKSKFGSKSLLPIYGMIIVIILHVIFSEKPFTFLIKERIIDQDVIIRSVVNVICESEEGDWSGSGTMLNSEGLVITNSHIIPQNEEYLLTRDEGCMVLLPNPLTGQYEEIYWATPIVYPGLSDEYDLAYLEVYGVFIDEDNVEWGTYPRTFSSLFSDIENYDGMCPTRSHKLGEAVRIFGYPQASGGLNLTITDGIISSFADDGSIYTSAKIDSGNSGGLAIDSRGCMIGVPVAIVEGNYQNLGVIIPINRVWEFLQSE